MLVSFIRHAESEANRHNISAGQLNYPLSRKGMKQADIIAFDSMEKNFAITHIISSPLLRAQQTAAAFALRYGLIPDIDGRLIECDEGVFSGQSRADIIADERYERIVSARWNWAPPEGSETYEDVAHRVTCFMESLCSRDDLWNGEQTHVLIVTHAIVLRLVRGYLAQSYPHYPIDLLRNGEIYQVNIDRNGNVLDDARHILLGDNVTTAHAE